MVLRYNATLKQALERENLPAALLAVKTSAESHGWMRPLETEYNRINSLQYSIRRGIESKIRQLRTGAIPWSPQLQQYRTDIEIWSFILKKNATAGE